MTNTVHVNLDGHRHEIEILGDRQQDGPNGVLLDGDHDLSSECGWSQHGFAVLPFLRNAEILEVRTRISRLFRSHLADIGHCVSKTWSPAQYHAEDISEDDHKKLVQALRQSVADVLGDRLLDQMDARLTEILQVAVSSQHPTGLRNRVTMRIVRPNKPDFNPPHRDAWIDHLRHSMNIYVPLFGSNAQTSLALVPGSHRWQEAEGQRTVGGASFSGNLFHVPAYLDEVNMVRPNPKPDEVLVFSPYILHGMGMNLDPNYTRISLEMRFWRVE